MPLALSSVDVIASAVAITLVEASFRGRDLVVPIRYACGAAGTHGGFGGMKWLVVPLGVERVAQAIPKEGEPKHG